MDEASQMLCAVSGRHILTYSIARNRNTAYENGELYEYGIECTLGDLNGNIFQSEHAHCVSADFHYVYNIASILAKNKVYPVHLFEILDDLISRDTLPQDDDNDTPLLCA